MSGDRAREDCTCEWNVESGNAGPDATCPQHGWAGEPNDRAREEIAAAFRMEPDDVFVSRLLPTVRALMAEAAVKALEEAADRPDLKSAMGRDAVGCQTLRDRARALTAHTEETDRG